MGPEGIILVNSPITTFQQSLTHSAMHSNVLLSTEQHPIEAQDTSPIRLSD